MRVLMLTWEYPPRIIGGVAPHVRDLARALVRRGCRVTVLSGPHPDVPAVASDRGVEVRRVESSFPVPPDFTAEVLHYNLALVESALSLAEGEGPFDVIHGHDWLVARAGNALTQLWNKPMVVTIHATEYGRNDGLHNPLQRYIHDMEWHFARAARHVITCSRSMRSEVRTLFHVPEEKIDVVPNGVDQSEFRMDAPMIREIDTLRRRMKAAGERLVFFMGRLVWEKGAQDLIDAMTMIRRHAPGARLIIAGDGPLKASLKEQVERLGLNDAVYFPGFVSGTRRRKLLALADVAVFPSRYEPFGIVALEAMASRVPVVVGDTGGLGEIVRHGANGLKATPGDAGSIAAQVVRLLRSPSTGRHLTEQARRDIESSYDWLAIARHTMHVYERALGDRRDSESVTVEPSTAYERTVFGPSPRAAVAGSRRGNGRRRYHPTDMDVEEMEPAPAR